MQNNAINNINNLKKIQDQMNTQMATQSKITRPSDDPVVAIRALRLRSDLASITQYNEKNIPDAKSWLSVTEGALSSTVDILTSMYANCVTGSSGYLTPDDRSAILADLLALREELYAAGDADYAGRSVFTGYRTGVSLSFQADTEIPYTITEQLTQSAVDTFTYINTGDLFSSTGDTTEYDVAAYEIARIRLSYDDLEDSDTIPTIQVPTGTQDADGNDILGPLQVNGGDVVSESVSIYDDPSPYELIATDPTYADKIIFVPETGEMLLGADVKAAIEALPKTDEVRITYEKSNWEEGDLRPEHYFACEAEVAGQTIEYNLDRLLSTQAQLDITLQYISYDVGFNQSIRVNTLASECFTHDIGRDVDELIAITQEALDMEEQIADMQRKLASDLYTDAEKEDFQLRLDAMEKAYEYIEDKCQKLYEANITNMQGYIDQANLAITNSGSRSARVDLVESRLDTQQTTFTELKDDNEGVDITALAINMESASLSYQAALLATSKIISNSLMNFI